MRPSRLAIALLLLAACRSTAAPAPSSPAVSAGSAAPAAQAAAAPDPAHDDRLGALLWFQTSAEYRILAQATYAEARRALDRALADRSWTALAEQGGDFAALPPAVIVDVDETVLDNSAYEAQCVLAGTRYDRATWKPWVERAVAAAVPGAVEFTQYAASRGVVTFYVTNRKADDEAATRRNLLALGFPVNETIDAVLAEGERPDYVSDKSSRRSEVARTHRVLLLVGDDLNDFLPARLAPEERNAAAERYAERWGVRWFLLPNPDYGSWERALTGFESGLTLDETLQRKLTRLKLPQ